MAVASGSTKHLVEIEEREGPSPVKHDPDVREIDTDAESRGATHDGATGRGSEPGQGLLTIEVALAPPVVLLTDVDERLLHARGPEVFVEGEAGRGRATEDQDLLVRSDLAPEELDDANELKVQLVRPQGREMRDRIGQVGAIGRRPTHGLDAGVEDFLKLRDQRWRQGGRHEDEGDSDRHHDPECPHGIFSEILQDDEMGFVEHDAIELAMTPKLPSVFDEAGSGRRFGGDEQYLGTGRSGGEGGTRAPEGNLHVALPQRIVRVVEEGDGRTHDDGRRRTGNHGGEDEGCGLPAAGGKDDGQGG